MTLGVKCPVDSKKFVYVLRFNFGTTFLNPKCRLGTVEEINIV